MDSLARLGEVPCKRSWTNQERLEMLDQAEAAVAPRAHERGGRPQDVVGA